MGSPILLMGSEALKGSGVDDDIGYREDSILVLVDLNASMPAEVESRGHRSRSPWCQRVSEPALEEKFSVPGDIE